MVNLLLICLFYYWILCGILSILIYRALESEQSELMNEYKEVFRQSNIPTIVVHVALFMLGGFVPIIALINKITK